MDCLFIAHSAKSSMNSRLVSYFHSGLAAHGFLSVKFNFPYAEGRWRLARKPDRTEILVNCYKRVAEETRKSEWKPKNLFVGGISIGAAVSSHVVADGPEISGVRGLFFLSYPPSTWRLPTLRRGAEIGGIEAGSQDANSPG
jgi:uncharacterized protein